MLSCLPISLYPDIISGKMPLKDWSVLAADCGLDAFDISILFVRDRTEKGLSAMRKDLEAGGLPLATVAIYSDFTTPDPLGLEFELAQAKADVHVASRLGASFIRMTAGQFYPDYCEEKQFDQVVRAFSEMADFAAKRNITLLWENHSTPGAWSHPDFDFNRERLLRLFDLLKGGPVRMNYDTANAKILGFGDEFLEQCYPDISSIHVNDVVIEGTHRFVGIGDGIADVAGTVRWLRKRGYDGLYSIEESAWQGAEGVRHYVSVVRKMLEE